MSTSRDASQSSVSVGPWPMETGQGGHKRIRIPVCTGRTPARLWGAYQIPEHVIIDGHTDVHPSEPEWHKAEDGALIVEASRDQAADGYLYSMGTTYRPGDGAVDVEIEFENRGDEDWERGGMIDACYGACRDPNNGYGTFVIHGGNLVCVRDLLDQAGLEPGPGVWPAFEVRDEAVQGTVTKTWVPGVVLDRGFVLRESADRNHSVAVVFEHPVEVMMHYHFLCLHSDPAIPPLKAGEKTILRGKVYVFEDTPKEAAVERYFRDFGG